MNNEICFFGILLFYLNINFFSIRSRDNQMNDAQRDLNSLKIENTEIYEENNKLNYDLDALKKHIELINELNNLVKSLFLFFIVFFL